VALLHRLSEAWQNLYRVRLVRLLSLISASGSETTE